MSIVGDQLKSAKVELSAPRGGTTSLLRFARGAAIHAVLVIAAIVVMVPLFWTLSTSLKDPGDIFQYPPAWWPDPIVFRNYYEAMTIIPFHVYFLNTVIITGASLVGQLVSCSLVAYSFARLRWPGRDTLFILMLATMMLPRQVTLIPQFILFRYLGWIDTWWPLIVPSFFGVPFFIFLLRQFFMGIPRDLDDAARLDGASNFRIFWEIILPLSKPVLAAVAIFSFQFTWNDFFEPLIYLHSSDLFTVSLALRFFQGSYGTQWHLLMAASVVAMAPMIILFFFAQRYFIQGIVVSGVKG